VEEQHSDQVRNEGLEVLAEKKKESTEEDQLSAQEVDLEIEAPGAANKVAEEGSLTI